MYDAIFLNTPSGLFADVSEAHRRARALYDYIKRFCDKNNIYDIVLGSVPKPPKQKPYMTKESEYINANQRKPAKADIKEFKS